MKKIILSILFLSALGFSSTAMGDDSLVNRSSYTLAVAGPVYISSTSPGTVLVGVVVSSSMPIGSGIRIYDSSANAVNQIGFISAFSVSATPIYIPYGVRISSGITYTTIGSNFGGYTIIWNPRAAKQ